MGSFCCTEQKTKDGFIQAPFLPEGRLSCVSNTQSTTIKPIGYINIKTQKPEEKNKECIKIDENEELFYTTQKKKKVGLTHSNFIKGEIKGRGKFGTVYSGLCNSTGEIVAIKEFVNIPPGKRELIINSLSKLYQLNHINLINAIKLDDPNTFNGNVFSIIYEICNGNSIENLVKKFGTFDEKIIRIYTKQILDGLEYLHSKGIIHQNLKLSNILVDANGTIRISDSIIDGILLGNGKEMYNDMINDETGKINYYIPPFFVQDPNKEINQAFDLWFLGCIIIEIFSGKNPWFQYNFKSQKNFMEFLSTTHLTPILPKRLSRGCQELLSILFNPKKTNDKDIYRLLSSLDFFNSKLEISCVSSDIDVTITNNNNVANNTISSNTISNTKGGMINKKSMIPIPLGLLLQKGHVVNILNNNDNATFSVTITNGDNISSCIGNSLFNNSLTNGPLLCYNKNTSENGNNAVRKNPNERIIEENK